MINLIGNFYLLLPGFRTRRLVYTFDTSEYPGYDDYVEHTYKKVFWKLYVLVKSTTYYDEDRSYISFKDKIILE